MGEDNVKEGQQFKDKEEALAAFESTLRNEPDKTDDKVWRSWEQLQSGIESKAGALGASEYETTRVRFSVFPEDERQVMFDVWGDTGSLEGKTLEESIAYLGMLVKIRDEFDLEDSK